MDLPLRPIGGGCQRQPLLAPPEAVYLPMPGAHSPRALVATPLPHVASQCATAALVSLAEKTRPHKTTAPLWAPMPLVPSPTMEPLLRWSPVRPRSASEPLQSVVRRSAQASAAPVHGSQLYCRCR